MKCRTELFLTLGKSPLCCHLFGHIVDNGNACFSSVVCCQKGVDVYQDYRSVFLFMPPDTNGVLVRLGTLNTIDRLFDILWWAE